MLQQNWSVISQAPFATLAIVLFVGGAAFTFGRFFLSEKLSNLESRLAQRDDLIAEYKEKLAGASPDEALGRMTALEKRLEALEPRNLKQEQLMLFSAIAAAAPGQLTILQDAAVASVLQLCRQIGTALTGSGWAINHGHVMGLGQPPMCGMSITCFNGDAVTPEASALSRAFDAVGLPYELRLMPERETPHEVSRPRTELLLTAPVGA